MNTPRIIIWIATAFVAGNILLIVVKYNSDKSIDNLVSDNNQLLKEFSVANEMKNLESNVWLIDSKIRGAITANDTSYIEGVKVQMLKVEQSLRTISQIRDDDSTHEMVEKLRQTVNQKLSNSNAILSTFKKQGKAAAEDVFAVQQGKKLTDSILQLANRISHTREQQITEVTDLVDDNVKKVQRLNSFLVIMVLVSAAGLFWYIINTIRKQHRLIHIIRESEKKVKEAAVVKENFMANMSHEIRTPMNAILGFTNLLSQKPLDDESKHYVNTIQHSGENLLSIVNDILDISKIEAGMMRIEAHPFSLRSLLHSIETLFQAKARQKGLALTTVVDPLMPDMLEGDATRLTQVLVNLMGNAIKFTESGNVSVNVNLKAIEDSTALTEIVVSDTGIGIAADKLKAIFERFEQADEATTRRFGGTGLGLSIVKDLVELQNGTIHAESWPGLGTKFIIHLPYRKAEDVKAEDMPDQRAVPAEKADLAHLRILAVEDNEINQSLLHHMFRNWNAEVELAYNGEEALQKLSNANYNLVLMDIQMPVMDGYTAIQKIRNELKLDTPVIAMTAHAMAGEKEKCLSYGMNDYISKPIQTTRLLTLIRKYTLDEPFVVKNEVAAEANGQRLTGLAYMREISEGDVAYEREVTKQFISALPAGVAALETAWQQKDYATAARVAHNLKSTIAIMELNQLMNPLLEVFESGNQDHHNMQVALEQIRGITEKVLSEARQFLSTSEKDIALPPVR